MHSNRTNGAAMPPVKAPRARGSMTGAVWRPCCTDRSGWRREKAGVGGRPFPRSRGAHLAVQSQRRLPPSCSPAAPQGDELARLRRSVAPARQPDGVVHRRGDRGLAGGATHDPGRAAQLLQPRHPDRADAQGRVPAGVPSDRGPHRLRHTPARPHSCGSRPQHAVPPVRDAGGAATAIQPGAEPVHLLVDSTGLKLCGAGEWLVACFATSHSPTLAGIAHRGECR